MFRITADYFYYTFGGRTFTKGEFLVGKEECDSVGCQLLYKENSIVYAIPSTHYKRIVTGWQLTTIAVLLVAILGLAIFKNRSKLK